MQYMIAELSPCSTGEHIVPGSLSLATSLARHQEQHCLVSHTYHHSSMRVGFCNQPTVEIREQEPTTWKETTYV